MTKWRIRSLAVIFIILAICGVIVIGVNRKGLKLGTTAVALPDAKRYTVKNGDSLYQIARDHGLTVNVLKSANQLSSDKLHTGQVIQIPDAGKVGNGEADVTVEATERYTVKAGDTLFLIAKRYGLTVAALQQANGLQSDRLTVGQVLVMPVKTGTKPSSYTVQPGDSLYAIATRFNMGVANLKAINHLNSDQIFPGQVLILTGNPGVTPAPTAPQVPESAKPLREILADRGISHPQLSIRVDKSAHTLSVYTAGTWLKTYHVELGDSGLGDKAVSGDHKTPQGTFYVAEISVLNPSDPYLGSRWMRLSYPNIEDADRGLAQGLIDQATHDSIVDANNRLAIPPQNTALGGGVGIHGGSTAAMGQDWTWGCVGLTNHDVEDFFDYVGVGTPVVIQQ